MTRKGLPKVYIIKANELFLFIGVTTQSLTSRFRYGFNAIGKNGYYGYQWKTRLLVELYVWYFEAFDRNQVENIEAELAFLIRAKTGKWPIDQNEIHFNNKFENGKEIALKCLKLFPSNYFYFTKRRLHLISKKA
ncbi:MAG: hypothetical protein EOO46_00340 [Flavobacterium sp.]|nr:MAG: hypothetical protein EOO46_00340 [Flavobacterium sp.]